MFSSASASRSATVTPGATAARSSSRVSPTSRPARRISTISASVLIWIMRSRLLNMPNKSLANTSPLEAGQRVDRAFGDILHRPGRVDTAQQPAVAVVADQRRGLVGVDLEAVAD